MALLGDGHATIADYQQAAQLYRSQGKEREWQRMLQAIEQIEELLVDDPN